MVRGVALMGYRELWQIVPTLSRPDERVTVWATVPSVGAVAPVAAAAFSGEVAIESRVIRVRRPVGVSLGADSRLVDRETNRTWRINEIATVGRRRFYDVSISTYVPQSSVDPPPVESEPPQANYRLAFQLVAPDGQTLRAGLIYPLVWTFNRGAQSIVGGSGTNRGWFVRPSSTVTGETQLAVPIDPVDRRLQASGIVVNPVWISFGATKYRARFSFNDTYPVFAEPGVEQVVPQLHENHEFPEDGADDVGLAIFADEQPSGTSIPSPGAVGGEFFTILKTSEIPTDG